MEIHESREKNALVVSVAGRINAQTIPALDQVLKQAVSRESVIVLDLSGVEYMASCGLRTLVSTHKQMSMRRGSLILRAPNASVVEVLEITGLYPMLTIE